MSCAHSLLDANVEISILKDQLTSANAQNASELRLDSQFTGPSVENLLKTAPPPNLDFASDSSPAEELAPQLDKTITMPKLGISRSAVPTSFISHSMLPPEKSIQPMPLKTTTNILRSHTLPSLPSPSSTRSLIRPPAAARTASTATTSSSGSLAKNKGVQMVSEMRARVRNLEQKIHTRVPRIRMTSITGRQSAASNNSTATPISSSSSVTSTGSTAKTSLDSQRKSVESRLSNDNGPDRHAKKDTSDSSGWVLIMEDSPSPQKDKEAKRFKERRRLSNPPSALFRPMNSTIRAPSPSLSTGLLNMGTNPLAVSTGLRLPKPRTSGGGSSSTSRPQTPTYLPVPQSDQQSSTSALGLKRSTGPNAANPYIGQLKRSSLGKGDTTPPVPPLPSAHRERPITMPLLKYRRDSGASSPMEAKDTPSLSADLTSNVTRRTNKIPASTSTSSVLGKSRIGRPSGGFSGRKSADALDINDLQPRSGSSAAD